MIVLLCTVSTLLAAFVVSQLLPVKYEASSRLLLDVARPDPVTGEVIATSQAKAYSRTQVELVRDQRVAGYAVQKLRLASDPKVLALAEDGALPRPATQRSLTDWLIEQTKAQLVDGSNVLAITVTAPDGELAQRLANALREGYVEATVGLRGERTRQTALFYTQQTEKARQALQIAEAAKSSFEKRTGLILEGVTDVDSARLQAMAGQAVPVGSAGVAAAAPATTPSSASLAQADAQIAQLSRTLGPNHPEMQELQRRRASLAATAAQERSAAIAAANAAAGVAARSANAGASAANQAYQAQRSRVIGQRGELEQLRRLQSEVDVRREQYSKTAARAAELRQQAEAADPSATLLGAATTPTSPASPNKPLILAGALGFGLAFGVLLALLLELLNRRVRGIEDMAVVTQVPLLAVISVPGDRGSRAGSPRLIGWSGQS
jgi:uncharacterized protein involved in exopolysaccharide biosynthesis